MSNDSPSRTFLLVEEKLGSSLRQRVMKMRGSDPRPKHSWAQIAHELGTETGVFVTSETLRIWFHDDERKRLARAVGASAA